ncbi:hypothetical protein FNF28_00248 [Cafeteria roenbergensis]|uniref:Uncharacterized protein n=1 Tax=Cafeteria roenbergensis TaxID=33653 RepID=A0A5A8E372_CAFRO|nr:hypothetical protein FNF28_00248 [Cafeteria roenbergensis]
MNAIVVPRRLADAPFAELALATAARPPLASELRGDEVLLEAFACALSADTIRCLAAHPTDEPSAGPQAAGGAMPELPLGGLGTASPSFLASSSTSVTTSHRAAAGDGPRGAGDRQGGWSTGRAPVLMGGTDLAPTALLAAFRPAVRALLCLARVPGGVQGRAVLVLDAASPFGLAAAQLCLAMGASAVVAAVRSDEERATAERDATWRPALEWAQAGGLAASREGDRGRGPAAAAVTGSGPAERRAELAAGAGAVGGAGATAAATAATPPAGAVGSRPGVDPPPVSVVDVSGGEGASAVLHACLGATSGTGVDVVLEPSEGCVEEVGFSDLVRCAVAGGTVLTCPWNRDDADVDADLLRLVRLKGLSLLFGKPEDVALACPLRYDAFLAAASSAVSLCAKGVVNVESCRPPLEAAPSDAARLPGLLCRAGWEDEAVVVEFSADASLPGTLLGREK